MLIQKEWIHFGHKFGDRLGLNFVDQTFKDSERSPIFLQFLDVVHQMMEQYPVSFEFTDKLLLKIMDATYNGRYGTFLFNYDSERLENSIQNSPSLWTEILDNQNEFTNPFYQTNAEPHILSPSSSVQHLRFWSSYFLQHLSPPPNDKGQEILLGKNMKQRISTLEDKVSILEREKEELVQKLKNLNQTKGFSNVTKTADNGSSNNLSNHHLLDEWVDMRHGPSF